VLVSVAALNRQHKRLDYLIDEVSNLPHPRPFLLIVGQPDGDTPAVRALAHRLLEENSYDLRTVPASEMGDIYRASDIFALASLAEAQGRALIEAMSHGLPCVAHDSPVMRFALGPHGVMDDLSQPGALAALIQSQLSDPRTHDRARQRHAFVYERFSWERLAPRYVDLLTAVARDELPRLPPQADDPAQFASATANSAARVDRA
jgi:glycosyltransferase involved in cell wall biosynthesis